VRVLQALLLPRTNFLQTLLFILHLVDRLEELFNESKSLPLTHKVIVDEERMLELIDQMRLAIPEEIKKAILIVKFIDTREGPVWQFRVGDKKMRLSKLKSIVLVFECTSHIQAFDREYVAHDTGQRDFV